MPRCQLTASTSPTSCKVTPHLRRQHAYSSFALSRCPLMNWLNISFLHSSLGDLKGLFCLSKGESVLMGAISDACNMYLTWACLSLQLGFPLISHLCLSNNAVQLFSSSKHILPRLLSASPAAALHLRLTQCEYEHTHTHSDSAKECRQGRTALPTGLTRSPSQTENRSPELDSVNSTLNKYRDDCCRDVLMTCRVLKLF